MSTNHKSIIVAERETCAVCNHQYLEVLLDLPDLPLTAKYSKEPMIEPVKGIDQKLLLCTECGHAQLAEQVNPEILYDDSYHFRTSTSATARRGTDFFLAGLDELALAKQFNCVLDVGCNDLHLLKRLQNRAKVRVGLDPLWIGKEDQNDDQGITIIGSTVEGANFRSRLSIMPDLIVCRHTLEHIYDPRTVLQKLLDVAAEDALFLFEVPGFDALVNRLRFDQVFHQHLQYFTLPSFQRLLEEVGGVYLSHWENYHDWGALLVAFTKKRHSRATVNAGDTQRHEKLSSSFDLLTIRERYAIFRQQMSATNRVLKLHEEATRYGYGAAQMLPVLSYHLNNDLSSLTAVLDDDPAKDGLHYWNLPVVIRHPSRVMGLKDSSIFITAVDNVKPILSKLLVERPRHIIYPFHII